MRIILVASNANVMGATTLVCTTATLLTAMTAIQMLRGVLGKAVYPDENLHLRNEVKRLLARMPTNERLGISQ